jgi:zinc protease
MNMLDEGAGDLDALEIADRLDRLGASLELGADLDTAYVNVSTLKANIDSSLGLFADVVLNPTFPAQELERLRQQTLAAIQQEMNRPQSIALRLFPRLVYGEGHAYAIPFTGSGTLESVREISREDLVAYHHAWFKPNNATLILAGDITMKEARPLIEKRLGSWRSGETPSKQVGPVKPPRESRVFVVDRPNSQQSIIIAGHVVPPYEHPERLALEAANDVLGGSFSARVNMNLREDKHWSYGARSIISSARGPQPFFVYAPVQTDRTAESMAEISGELRGIAGGNPPTEGEVVKVKDQNTLTLPGRWETHGAVLDAISEVVRYGLPDGYWDQYPQRVRALDVPKVSAAARTHLHPGRLTWVVIGDWQKIRESVQDLDIGPIQLLDASGHPL